MSVHLICSCFNLHLPHNTTNQSLQMGKASFMLFAVFVCGFREFEPEAFCWLNDSNDLFSYSGRIELIGDG